MKINILFVDDEQIQLKSFQRIFHSTSNSWKLYLADSGEEALKILADEKIDVIVTDKYMPLMDGTAVLDKVKETYPHIIRIIITGYIEGSGLASLSKNAHLIFSKPFDMKIIKSKIEKVCHLQRKLNNENLLEIINSIDLLPRQPELYFKLEEELSSPIVSLEEICNIISRDISITAKIMQLVNSGFFSLENEITNLYQAISILGLNTIKSLALYSEVFSSARMSDKALISVEQIWEHSLKVANIAKKMIMQHSHDKKLQDLAYLAGLLHDTGKLILFNIPEYCDKITKRINEKKIPCHQAEFEILGTTHSEVGAYVLGLWGLPEPVIEAVAYHHYPTEIEENNLSVPAAVYLANSLEKVMTYIDLKNITDFEFQAYVSDFMKVEAY